MRHLLLFALLLGCAVPAWANTSLAPQVGRDYLVLKNPVSVTSDKIEVRQFFSYRCWTCYQQSVVLQPFLKTLPKDVRFVRTALPSSGSGGNDELKVYYALEQMQVADRVHMSLLKNSGVRGREALTPKAITAVMLANGVYTDRFNKLYDSPVVISRIRAGANLAHKLGIQKVPAVVVNGKYLVIGKSENTNRTIRHLIAVERQLAASP